MIKKILLLTVCVSSLMAKQEQESFLQAGSLYQEGKVAQALTLYEALPIKSAGTLYNLGNCAYRLGDKGSAVGYWFRALPKAPRFMYPWLFANLEKAQDELSLPVVSSWQKFFLYVQSYSSLTVLQVLSLLVASVLLLLMCLRKLRWYTTLCLSVVLGLLVATSFATYMFWYAPHVVVINPRTQVYTGPDEQFPVLKEIPLGMRVRVVGVQDSWYKISYLKNRGWIQQSCVMNIL